MSYTSPSTGRVIKAVLFDTFGSVVDWRTGVARASREFFNTHEIDLDAEAFADAWRARYEPSMEAVRTGEREFTPLDELHMENLFATLREAGVDQTRFPKADLDALNASWERLDPWPDSIAGLAALSTDFTVGPLSNANTSLLLRMAKNSGLPWNVVLGSDTTRAYKPTSESYLGMAALLRLEPGEVMMAAAHNYDLLSARDAGLATAFIARPTELGANQTKDLVAEHDWDLDVNSITELAAAMIRGN